MAPLAPTTKEEALYDVGVDIGGTFTDIVCRGSGGELSIVKVPTTPDDRATAVMTGLSMLHNHGIANERIRQFTHGTTVATNAVLEAKGARVGVITTGGFRDVLEIGRQLRTSMYDLVLQPQTPVFLAPRHMRAEVDERVSAQGEVLKPLRKSELIAAAQELVDRGAQSLAVIFLFSFVNPVHEQLAGAWISEHLRGIDVSLSHEVDPAFREYERSVTTAFDAYVKPLVNSYLLNLERELRRTGVSAPPQVIQSRGGLTAAAVARKRPVRLLLSGPAGGVVGASIIAASANVDDVITIDIGGTSADIALISDRSPVIRTEGRIGGFDIRVPMVDVNTIGAGGGSIARVDDFGNLRVGPDSAGADPGPACYGNGGANATVTDASLVLGYLDPSYFGGGLLPLYPDLAIQALRREIADPLGLSVEEAALGVHRVLNAQMAEAIRLVSVRQGIDPRKFALIPLGGAGGIHATALARDLGIAKIIVPPNPGVLAAAGLLWAPIEHEVSAAFGQRLSSLDTMKLKKTVAELDRRAADLMALEQVKTSDMSITYSADVCFVGQSYTIEVPLHPNDPDAVTLLHDNFLRAHDRVYGHAVDGEMKIVSVRSVHRASPTSTSSSVRDPSSCARPNTVARKITVGQGSFAAQVYNRSDLTAGTTLSVPAVVQQPDTTTIIDPGWTACVDTAHNLILSRSP